LSLDVNAFRFNQQALDKNRFPLEKVENGLTVLILNLMEHMGVEPMSKMAIHSSLIHRFSSF